MTYDNYIDESEQERRERLQSGRCCWHCRYYIRQTEGITLDGPQGSICTIDHVQSEYKVSGEMALGETIRNPDYYCARFEMDEPYVRY